MCDGGNGRVATGGGICEAELVCGGISESEGGLTHVVAIARVMAVSSWLGQVDGPRTVRISGTQEM